MTSFEDFRLYDIQMLASNCASETEKFLRRLSSDTRHCFEIFRRAYAELREDALSHIYEIYLPLLARRARRHPLYFQSCQNDDYFARVALSNFYRVNQGAQFEAKFSALESVIKYLYACLHSAIAQDVRENAQMVEAPNEDTDWSSAHVNLTTTLDAAELWSHIVSLLPEPEHQRLAYLRFVLAMKPAEIVKSEPKQWADEREVSVALQLVRRRLRKDRWLREQAGFDENSDETD